MKSLGFYILDVFAEDKYAGNQLAVVTNGQGLSGERMQQIAREFNFSETTFILSGRQDDGGYDVRIFTPGEEVPFAGHPTVGTAWAIRNLLTLDRPGTIRLNLKVGQIPVAFDADTEIAWMTTKEPVFGETFEAQPVADLLGLQEGDIDTRYPIQGVSTGLQFILTPLKTLDGVKRVRVNTDKLLTLIGNRNLSKTIFVFCPETLSPEHQVHARMFAHYYGIPEDPATGSANSCLAGYLAKYHYFGTGTIDVKVEQGYEMGRPSLLHLKARQKTKGSIEVQVGGKVQLIAKGELI